MVVAGAVAAVWKTPVISYWATAPALSDKNVYAYFGRTIPHDDFTSFALVNTIASIGWKALAILYPDNLWGQVRAMIPPTAPHALLATHRVLEQQHFRSALGSAGSVRRVASADTERGRRALPRAWRNTPRKQG